MNLRVQVQIRRYATPLSGYYTMYVWLPIGTKKGVKIEGPDGSTWTVYDVYGSCIRDLDEERNWE